MFSVIKSYSTLWKVERPCQINERQKQLYYINVKHNGACTLHLLANFFQKIHSEIMVTNIPGVVNQPTLIVSNFRIFLRNFTVFDNLEGNCKALKDRTTDETFINCLKANYKSELQKEKIERFELLLWLMKELRLVSRKTLELNRLTKASISTQWQGNWLSSYSNPV